MKLNVGDKVFLHTAAGPYWTEIVDVVPALNARYEICDWYVHCPTQRRSEWGALLPKQSRFNEYMANQLVKEVK
jgi:hypothetical protein